MYNSKSRLFTRQREGYERDYFGCVLVRKNKFSPKTETIHFFFYTNKSISNMLLVISLGKPYLTILHISK